MLNTLLEFREWTFSPTCVCFARCQKMALCHLLLSQNSTGHYSNQIDGTGPPESKTRGRRYHMLLDEKKADKVRTQLTKTFCLCLSQILWLSFRICKVAFRGPSTTGAKPAFVNSPRIFWCILIKLTIENMLIFGNSMAATCWSISVGLNLFT